MLLVNINLLTFYITL